MNLFTRFIILILKEGDQLPLRETLDSVHTQSIDAKMVIVDKSYQGIQSGLESCSAGPDDVVVLLEAHDRLFTDSVLDFLHALYQKVDLLFTCSRYLEHETGKVGEYLPPTPKEIIKRDYRKRPYKGLKSFRAKLVDALIPSHIDSNNLESTLTYPLLELAGPKIHFYPNIHLISGSSYPWQLPNSYPKYPLL